jgi:hypothetical protein
MDKDEKNPEEGIREAALKHRNATEQELIAAVGDVKDTGGIREAALKNPNATEQVLRKGLRP